METQNKRGQIVLGGGCFWCMEAVFNTVKGVAKATPGYAGGTTVNPSYDEVCGGNTGHAEVALIEYDRGQACTWPPPGWTKGSPAIRRSAC